MAKTTMSEMQCQLTTGGWLHVCTPDSLSCTCGALKFTAKGVLQAALSPCETANLPPDYWKGHITDAGKEQG